MVRPHFPFRSIEMKGKLLRRVKFASRVCAVGEKVWTCDWMFVSMVSVMGWGLIQDLFVPRTPCSGAWLRIHPASDQDTEAVTQEWMNNTCILSVSLFFLTQGLQFHWPWTLDSHFCRWLSALYPGSTQVNKQHQGYEKAKGWKHPITVLMLCFG